MIGDIRKLEHMLFRLTQKLAKKIKVVPATAMPSRDNPFLDWTAHLFMVYRWQCIMLTNSRSLYSVIMPGKGITSEGAFAKATLKYLYEYMVLDDTAFLFDTHIAPHIDTVTFCKAGDRRVLGSMNDLIYHTKVHILEGRKPPLLVNGQLNEMPMSMLAMDRPRDAFMSLADQ